MHEHGFPPRREDRVGVARQILPVLAKAVAQTLHQTADQEFRLRVRTPHAPHSFTALIGAKRVHPTSPFSGGHDPRALLIALEEFLHRVTDQP